MALLLGTNTFVTLADSDLYFTDQLGGEAWTDLPETDKEKALIAAWQKINAACAYEFSADSAPENVKIAQCELANAIYKNFVAGITVSVEQELKKLKAGPAELEFFPLGSAEAQDVFSDYIKQLLNNECACGFSNSGVFIGTLLY